MDGERRPRRRLGLVRKLGYVALLPLATRAPGYGRLVLALLADSRIPASRKALLAVAAGYVVSPADIVPDRIPILGALDDVAIIVLALDVFLEGVPDEVLQEKLAELGMDRRELERDLDNVRRVLPRPVRAVMRRLPDAIDGAARLVRRSGVDSRLRNLVMEERPA